MLVASECWHLREEQGLKNQELCSRSGEKERGSRRALLASDHSLNFQSLNIGSERVLPQAMKTLSCSSLMEVGKLIDEPKLGLFLKANGTRCFVAVGSSKSHKNSPGLCLPNMHSVP